MHTLCSVAHIGSLSAVDPQLWDAVADPRDLYQSHAWLRALESTDDAALTYLIARNDGRPDILGALPLFAPPTTRGDTRYWPELHFRDLLSGPALLGDRLGLLAGSGAGFRTRLVLDRSLPPAVRAGVLRSLLDAAAGVAAGRGLAYVFFLFLDVTDGREVAAALGGAGHARLAAAAQTELHLPGATFDDYLATLPRNVRTGVRRETAVHSGSCSTEVVPLRDVIPVVASLVAGVQAKHGVGGGAETVGVRLRAYHRALGADRARAVVCRSGDRIVGASVLCRSGDRLYVTDFGRSEDDDPAGFLYFNAAIYEPIRYAYAHGVPTVVTGAGVEQGKGRRGATLLPLTHLAVPAGDHLDPVPAEPPPDAGTRSRWRRERTAHPRYFGPVWDDVL